MCATLLGMMVRTWRFRKLGEWCPYVALHTVWNDWAQMHLCIHLCILVPTPVHMSVHTPVHKPVHTPVQALVLLITVF